MQMEEKIRAFDLDGNRRQIRLDTKTWAVIDMLAKESGLKWPKLAVMWASKNPEDAKENLTAVIRSGAMSGLLALKQGGEIAQATAAATTTPGIIRVDWVGAAARGCFMLDSKEAEHLSQTLESARMMAAADELEACGESEEDREDRNRRETDSRQEEERRAMEREDELKNKRKEEIREIDRAAELAEEAATITPEEK
jgi:predicted DNA-binding ribbon-helix-helix protein